MPSYASSPSFRFSEAILIVGEGHGGPFPVQPTCPHSQ